MLLLISPSLPSPEAVRQRFKGVAAEAECQGRPVKEDSMASGKYFLAGFGIVSLEAAISSASTGLAH